MAGLAAKCGGGTALKIRNLWLGTEGSFIAEDRSLEFFRSDIGSITSFVQGVPRVEAVARVVVSLVIFHLLHFALDPHQCLIDKRRIKTPVTCRAFLYVAATGTHSEATWSFEGLKIMC